jgi:hypothetical protein
LWRGLPLLLLLLLLLPLFLFWIIVFQQFRQE